MKPRPTKVPTKENLDPTKYNCKSPQTLHTVSPPWMVTHMIVKSVTSQIELTWTIVAH
jgi:hypothetical protein